MVIEPVTAIVVESTVKFHDNGSGMDDKFIEIGMVMNNHLPG